ncbi:hypothetical protein HK100_001000 [Physocladia obscura]|uniref:P-loop containing nucleoside triphosphate hydrolase protein n=1 Tax=Physocladia obscura TaxID=109957 RepID=A0AAD5T021_9FUNG|nr:hypothetical protein HK100_001000 [Physocladia obscura]
MLSRSTASLTKITAQIRIPALQWRMTTTPITAVTVVHAIREYAMGPKRHLKHTHNDESRFAKPSNVFAQNHIFADNVFADDIFPLPKNAPLRKKQSSPAQRAREKLALQKEASEKMRLAKLEANRRLMQEMHKESEPPCSAATERFPDTFKLNHAAFLEYYTKRFSVPPPQQKHVEFQSFDGGKGKKGRGGLGSKKWSTMVTIPTHSIVIENKQPVEIEKITVKGIATARRKSEERAIFLLTEHLLAKMDECVIADFIDFATPLKTKIQQVTAKSTTVTIPEDILQNAESLFAQLKKSNAFNLFDADDENAKGDLDDGFLGRKPHSVTNVPKIVKKTDPSGIVTPPDLNKSKDLPMYNYFAKVMAAIDNNPVTIISASTGAGKTTQLPQFILSYFKHYQKREKMSPFSRETFVRPPNVIVTQPRRIAAISVAQRVAKERGESIGKDSAIGYNVRFQTMSPKSDPKDGHVMFCTSGILLRMLQSDPDLNSVTHIILDEVHERDLNTDLLLIIVRNLIERRPDLKVILMSATADTELFAQYFAKSLPVTTALSSKLAKIRSNNPIISKTSSIRAIPAAPIITVPGRTYPVKEFHLEDWINLLPIKSWHKQTQKYIENERNNDGNSRTRSSDIFPVDLYELLLAHIMRSCGPGAVLVFLPGWQEISLLMQKLKDDAGRVGFSDENRCKIYALHSNVSSAGQEEVFERPKNQNVRKIILSTNIAETSVTINDIVYVIDSGKMRINSYDASARISSLSCVDAAQSNLKQRSGRAGRCQPGEYYSMLSLGHRQSLPYNIPPELLRIDLQNTALKIKSLNLSPNVAEVFALAPQPPSSIAVTRALSELRTLGALATTVKPSGKYGSIRLPSSSSGFGSRGSRAEGQGREILTPLGKCLANMQMDPWLAKLVISAACFRALDPIVSAACILESGSRGIYAIHPDLREKARKHIIDHYAIGKNGLPSESDLIAMVNAYELWKDQRFERSRRDFAYAGYLNHTLLLNTEKGREQLLQTLEDLRVTNGKLRTSSIYNTNAKNLKLVRALISGALFPNVAEIRERNIYGTPFDGKLKVSGSTMNSYSALQIVASKVSGSRTEMFGEEKNGSSKAIDPEDVATDSVIEDTDSDQDDQSTAFLPPIIPPRFLSYHEKQMMEGAVWLRTTTTADPLALILFASFSNDSGLLWIKSEESGKWVALINGWIRIEFDNERSKKVVVELREWMSRYLDFVVAGNGIRDAGYSTNDDLAEKLVQLVARVIDN